MNKTIDQLLSLAANQAHLVRHSVFQLLKHFAQNWPLGLAENTVPKLAIIFKEVLGVVDAGYVMKISKPTTIFLPKEQP